MMILSCVGFPESAMESMRLSCTAWQSVALGGNSWRILPWVEVFGNVGEG